MNNNKDGTELDGETSEHPSLDGSSPFVTSPFSPVDGPTFYLPPPDVSNNNNGQSSTEHLSELEITLQHLPDAQPGERPKHKLHKLMQYAIQGSPLAKLCFNEIVDAITAKFPFWYNSPKRQEDLGNNVRHHLSWYPKFVQNGEKPEGATGKSLYWTIDPLRLDEPPRKKPKKEINDVEEPKASHSKGPTGTFQKKKDRALKANPRRSLRPSFRRTRPHLVLKGVAGPSTAPHSQLSPQPSTISPPPVQYAADLQGLPVTPSFASNPSPFPSHPRIPATPEPFGSDQSQHFSGMPPPLAISPHLLHIPREATPPHNLSAPPLDPSDPSLLPFGPTSGSLAGSFSNYPASQAYHPSDPSPQAGLSTFQQLMPQSQPFHLFQVFGPFLAPSASSADTLYSNIPCLSYDNSGQMTQYIPTGLPYSNVESVIHSPVGFSFDHLEGQDAMSSADGPSRPDATSDPTKENP